MLSYLSTPFLQPYLQDIRIAVYKIFFELLVLYIL
jgi:hypothetical protein